MYVENFFSLECDEFERYEPNFGYNGYGELVFYRTYSRMMNGKQERWADVVRRVINGVMSIRKDWYIKNSIEWRERHWQHYAAKMAMAMFHMHWLPPGRGLWAMGTPYLYERGAMCLYNCGATHLGGNLTLGNDLHWLMDALMCGVGVGFKPTDERLDIYIPKSEYVHIIPDTREGWCDSVELLVDSFLFPNQSMPRFVYSKIRPAGSLIKGFGGKASGPEPLKKLHEQICAVLTSNHSPVRKKTDLANMIGNCVVAGNVRRSAEIAIGSIHDQEFMDLKNYGLYPERAEWGGLSNNSVGLYDPEDFDKLGEISKRVTLNGEPGLINFKNFKYGRIGKPVPVREDEADLLNPCGEIPLEDKELCNVDETLPTVCEDEYQWYEACEFATFYCSTVALLPTHRPETNKVIVKNRRIGVGIIDWTGWVHEEGLHNVTKYMRKGYDIITRTNKELAAEAGVPESIRKTTIKPGGTIPKLAGKTPGIGYPTFRETLRRTRIAANHPMCETLNAAGLPWEPSEYDPNTLVYEYPIVQGPVCPATEVTIWEQAVNIATVQREWADNSVSNTIYFKPKWELIKTNPEDLSIYNTKDFKVTKNFWGVVEVYQYNPNHEEDELPKVIAAFAPLVKAMSFLPHFKDGVYKQMPESGLTREEYIDRVQKLKLINWDNYEGSDGEDERFCQGGVCDASSIIH